MALSEDPDERPTEIAAQNRSTRTVRDCITSIADQFHILLRKHGVDEAAIEEALSSGYTVRNNPRTLYVWDTFYGDKELSGLLDVKDFAAYLVASTSERRKKRWSMQQVKYQYEFSVSSTDEILAILRSSPHDRLFKAGAMCFRGQIEEYFFSRPVPNPLLAQPDDRERLILPAYWRDDRHDYVGRPADIYGGIPAFNILYDELVYYGIRPGKVFLRDSDHPTRNERRKIERRYRRHKKTGHFFDKSFALTAVNQHYGVPTQWLDLTFEVPIAAFFATHQFLRTKSDTLRCSHAGNNHDRVIYAFVFHSPEVTRTTGMIKELGILGHIRPLRPRVQKCGLRHCGPFAINEPVADLHVVFHLKPNFSVANLPTFRDLFPPPERDHFYNAVLELKGRFPDEYPYCYFEKYEV